MSIKPSTLYKIMKFMGSDLTVETIYGRIVKSISKSSSLLPLYFRKIYIVMMSMKPSNKIMKFMDPLSELQVLG